MCHARGDAAVASASLSVLQDTLVVAETLHSAFPAAPEDTITDALAHHGNISSAYLSLSDMFVSSWDPEATLATSLLQPSLPLPVTLLMTPSGTLCP